MKIRVLKANKFLLNKHAVKFSELKDDIKLFNQTQVICSIKEISKNEINHFKKLATHFPSLLKVHTIKDEILLLSIKLEDMDNINKLINNENSNILTIINECVRRTLNITNDSFETNMDYGLDLSQTKVMGILNVTPDSFSDGGKYVSLDNAVKQAGLLESEGADIIDIGGESSRPGSDPVPTDIEIERVIPVIKEIRKKSNILISIDTYKAKVAEFALQAGANWINDISGLKSDQKMINVAKSWDCPVVVMHMKGVPKTMQNKPVYENVLAEIGDFFEERIEFLKSKGINKIILDPGIGFGKRLEDNLSVQSNLEYFKQFGFPILLGASRKSFLGEMTGKEIHDRAAGTLTSVVWSLIHGANIVRVHEVASAIDSINVLNNLTINKN